MIILIILCILFVLAVISNIIDTFFYIKGIKMKARCTMIENKALRQVRDKLDNLLKKISEKEE